MRTLKLAACALLCVGLAACEQQIQDSHPDQVVTKRRAIFKQLNRAMEPIGLVANGRKEATPQELQVLVRDLEQLSSKPWVYFTPDGNYPPSRATASVWNDPDAFKKAQDQYLGTVQALTAAVGGTGKEAVQTAVNDVVASCKACHKQFRLD